MSSELLQIRSFSLHLKSAENRELPVLEDISLRLERGSCLGLAGESGSGKSVLALGIMGLLPRESISSVSGSILFDETELLGLGESSLRKLRGKRIAMVFQEPMTAMNPLMTLYEQVGETVRAHLPQLPEKEVETMVEKALRAGGFPEPATFYDSFPHQLSGGMRQRAMLAMSLVMEPDLIIADEPTTALDAALQVQLLAELRDLVKQKKHSLLFISHDLGVIRAIADQLAILYAGQLMETGRVGDVLDKPFHPYTSALVAAMPRLIPQKILPKAIPGHLPSPDRKPAGCVFSDRCFQVRDECRKAVPPLREIESGRAVRCLFPLAGV